MAKTSCIPDVWLIDKNGTAVFMFKGPKSHKHVTSYFRKSWAEQLNLYELSLSRGFWQESVLFKIR